MRMTVPAYRAGTGPQPDPSRDAAREAVDDLFRMHAFGLVRFALMLAISTWDNGYPTDLIPVGGLPLVWNVNSFLPYEKGDFTAYLLNPATRTRTTLRLHGIPLAQYLKLAW